MSKLCLSRCWLVVEWFRVCCGGHDNRPSSVGVGFCRARCLKCLWEAGPLGLGLLAFWRFLEGNCPFACHFLPSAAQFEGGAPSLQPSFEAVPRSEGAPPSIWPRLEAIPRSEGTPPSIWPRLEAVPRSEGAFAYSSTSGLSLRALLTLSLTGRTA